MKEHAEGPMAKELSQNSNPACLALELAFFASPRAPAAWRSSAGCLGSHSGSVSPSFTGRKQSWQVCPQG